MASNADQSRSPPSAGLLAQVLPKLRPFQREALEFATEGKRYQRQCAGNDSTKDTTTGVTAYDEPSLQGKGRILLADEMGLGKTVTSMAIMAYYEHEWPLLILCPASLRYTWPAEIEKFFPSLPPSSVYVAAGFSDIAFAKRKDVRIVIVTYSLLQNRSAVAQILQDQNFKCIIADESHNLKQKKSQRAQMILPVLRQSRRLVFLSGTPALARPVELWTQLSCLAPKFFGNWTTFTKRYCNPQRKFIGGRVHMDYSGSSHEKELHSKLQNVMVRRLKSNVLTELPPKQRSIICTGISRDQQEKCKRVIVELSEKRVSVKDLVGDAAREADFEARSLMMAAYQQSGIGKAQAIADYLLDWLAGSSETEKILVFCHHQAVLDVMDQKLLAKYPNSHIRIDGSVPTAVRSQLVRKFQTCARIRVGLLSMTAAGVGLNLTAASTVLFAELHWTPGVLAQAEDRVHRIGQQSRSVQILYMVCKDEKLSLDMALWNMLGKKIGTLGQVVDGTEDKPYIYTATTKESHASDGAEGASLDDNQGKSVQHELTSFFAETSAEEAQKKKRVPVKGSIESFFRKVPTKKASSSLTSFSDKSQKSQPKERPSVARTSVSSVREDVAEVTWACDACTFINSKPGSQVDWLPCELCGNLYKASDGNEIDAAAVAATKTAAKKPPVENVSYVASRPRSTSSGLDCKPTAVPLSQTDQVVWTCQMCTFENTKSRSKSSLWYPCDMCGEQHLPIEVDSDDSSEVEGDVLDQTPNFARTPAATKSDTAARVTASHRRGGPRSSRVSSASEVIVIDGTDDDDSAPSKSQPVIQVDAETTAAHTNRKSKDVCSDVIVIDLPARAATSSREGLLRPTHELTFSVSKNSGRIAIHFANTGSASGINFDLEQVVTSETADHLLDARVKKRNSKPTSKDIAFNEAGVQRTIGRMDLANGLDEDKRSLYAAELKAFVSNYLALREVEKKALKDSAQPFPASGVAQSAAKLMTSTLGGTERYVGGAKERAQENFDKGTATAVDEAVLNGKACAWCAKPLHVASVAAESIYCTQVCAEEGRLRRGGMYASSHLRSAAFALEGGKCSQCGIDAHALFEQIRALEPAQRLNKLLAVDWKLPKSGKAVENLLQNPKEGDFWQVDHIRAVAEGGGGCGLENLRTLCVPCHLLETEKLRSRLKLQSPVQQDDEEINVAKRHKQVDIRSAFFGGTKRARK